MVEAPSFMLGSPTMAKGKKHCYWPWLEIQVLCLESSAMVEGKSFCYRSPFNTKVLEAENNCFCSQPSLKFQALCLEFWTWLKSNFCYPWLHWRIPSRSHALVLSTQFQTILIDYFTIPILFPSHSKWN